MDLAAAPVFALTLAAALALFTLVWAIHVKIEDAGIVDFAWGGAFAVTGWLAVLLVGSATSATLLLIGLTTLWAIRLTAHMVWRHGHMDGEDSRYKAMRQAGGPSWWWASLFKVYWIQAVVQWIVALPLVIAATMPAADVAVLPLAVGTALFAAGFVVEAVADRQLWSFKAKPQNRGRLMTEGLFAWSRHPNYFGETVLWWGLGLIAFAATGAYAVFVSPAILTMLLLKVSGVSLLDAHLERTKPGFAAWARRTPAFVPRPPRQGLPLGDRDPAE